MAAPPPLWYGLLTIGVIPQEYAKSRTRS